MTTCPRATSITCLAVLIAGGVCLLLSGCATGLSAAGAKIQEADPKTVEGCTYLADVHGSSGWGNLAASTGMQNAKNEAIERAAALGATHVVWTNIAGGFSPYVSGRAYLCK
jgi:LDH2 family malate/lactate/ureidoglycolate dehydrogenase